MTWTTAPSRSTSQKGGDTDRFQTAQNITEAIHQSETETRERGPFDFLPPVEADMAEMSMEIDDIDSPVADSELEDIALTGQSTISLVKVCIMLSVDDGLVVLDPLHCSSRRRSLAVKVNSQWRLHHLRSLSSNSDSSAMQQS